LFERHRLRERARNGGKILYIKREERVDDQLDLGMRRRMNGLSSPNTRRAPRSLSPSTFEKTKPKGQSKIEKKTKRWKKTKIRKKRI
jgi:hypothetical protein